MSRRAQRVGEQLKREISQLLRTQVHDPRVSGVTVTSVEVSPDLTFARIWVQLSGEEDVRRTALDGLSAAAPFVRRQLGSMLHVRRIPELDFRQDVTLEKAMRIEALLRQVSSGPREGNEEADEQEREEEGADDEEHEHEERGVFDKPGAEEE
jgi:ribosome-binding factor A